MHILHPIGRVYFIILNELSSYCEHCIIYSSHSGRTSGRCFEQLGVLPRRSSDSGRKREHALQKLGGKLWKDNEAIKISLHKRIYCNQKKIRNIAVQSGDQVCPWTIPPGEWTFGAPKNSCCEVFCTVHRRVVHQWFHKSSKKAKYLYNKNLCVISIVNVHLEEYNHLSNFINTLLPRFFPKCLLQCK